MIRRQAVQIVHKQWPKPRAVSVELQTIDIRSFDDLEPAFQAFQAGRVEGVDIVSSAMLQVSGDSSGS